MNFYIDTLFNDIKEQSERLMATSQRLQFMIPDMDGSDAVALRARLSTFAHNNNWEICFKVADECYAKGSWSENERASLADCKANGNLTQYRNVTATICQTYESCTLANRSVLQVLVGVALVTDKGSLADFYQCDNTQLLQGQMKGSFSSWAEKYFGEKGIDPYPQEKTKFVEILERLHQRTNLQSVSRWLEHSVVSGNSADEVMKDLLRHLDAFNLPNLSGFLHATQGKKRGFDYYVQTADAFTNYDLFLEQTKRDKALKNITEFREDETKTVPQECYEGQFELENAFLDTLAGYVRERKLDSTQQLKACDFVYYLDNVLLVKPKKEVKPPKETLYKLAGSPVEVVLRAVWQSLEKFDGNTLTRITLTGKKFCHDYQIGSTTKDEIKEFAQGKLTRLLGGLNEVCEKHIQLALDDDDPNQLVAVESNLLNDALSYTSAKTAEPFFEFWVALTNDQEETLEAHFALKLPEIHPYRLADDLFSLAQDGLEHLQGGGSGDLPVFHFEYYKELMMAREADEVCRVMSHCVKECKEDDTFIENIFTPVWQKRPNVTPPMKSQIQEVTCAYRAFIKEVNEQGLYSALSLGSTPQIITAYTKASAAFMEGELKQPKLAAMLMRSFLFIERKPTTSVNTWNVAKFEPSGVITLLHPALIEMLQSQITFLFTSFSKAAVSEFMKSTKDRFKKNVWSYYVDMAEMKMPLTGLLVNTNDKFEVCAAGHELVHRIGNVTLDSALATTRFMVRYDAVDEEDIAEAELFRESSESKHLARILTEYCKMHTSAKDGISLAVYRNDDIQPILAALDQYIHKLADEKQKLGVELNKRHNKYAIKVVFFSESSDVSGVANWINQWQNFLEEAEDDTELYGQCNFTLSHRIVKTVDEYKQFSETIRKDIDADLFVFYNFIKPGIDGCSFQVAEEFDATQDPLKFPILEKAQCSSTEPDALLKRAQIVSNRQFKISAAHVEVVARLKDPNANTKKHHIVLANGDFTPWQTVIDSAHESAEWVVCIDANIDEALIGYERDSGAIKRELIGYGSGVGLHGESNYTISTQKYCMADIEKMLKSSIRIFEQGTDAKDETIAKRLLKEAKSLAGISLIRALGPSEYIRDFMAYCLMHRILPLDTNVHLYLCDKVFSIDAYRHWFDQASADDRTHPDLLWLRTSIVDGRIHIDAKLIECKMAKKNDEMTKKAKEQIQNGLKVLVDVFCPKRGGRQDAGRPDQRYWYLQLHRMIASCSCINEGTTAQTFLEAMERLTSGDFTISWGAGIFAFWTNSVSDKLVRDDSFEVPITDDTVVNVPIFVVGYDFVHNICAQEDNPHVDWEGQELAPVSESANAPTPKREITESEGDIVGEECEIDPDEEPTATSTLIEIDHDGVTAALNIPEVEPLVHPHPIVSLNTSRPFPSRVLLGKTNGGQPVYWEFGHHKLNNRHFLIFGNSGTGKTYAIQAILCELGHQSQNSLIVDYTNGFLKSQLQIKTNEILAPVQYIVKSKKLPISPFAKQSQNLGDGELIEESNVDVAKRVTSIFDTVYNLGKQQVSILIDAIKMGIQHSGEAFSLAKMLSVLESFIGDNIHPKGSVQSIIGALNPFISEEPFSNEQVGWDSLFTDTERHCHVFQMAMMERMSYLILTEFVLWDLYSFVRSTGNEKKPRVVVLDEVQNLDQRLDAPLGKFLTEGRKFGISLITATQTLGNLKADEQARLFQAAHKLFFTPAATEINQYADLVQQFSGAENRAYWVNELSSLKRGECLSIGPSLNENTGDLVNKVQRIKITALEDRGF